VDWSSPTAVDSVSVRSNHYIISFPQGDGESDEDIMGIDYEYAKALSEVRASTGGTIRGYFAEGTTTTAGGEETKRSKSSCQKDDAKDEERSTVD